MFYITKDRIGATLTSLLRKSIARLYMYKLLSDPWLYQFWVNTSHQEFKKNNFKSHFVHFSAIEQ